ncbi:MAG: hypothetical protein WBA51_11795 [Erythrobacter sp.]
MTILYYAAGAIFGLAVLLPFRKATEQTLTENGYVSLVSMLMIYLGAHLVNGELSRVTAEVIFSMITVGFAMVCRFKWPVAVGILILLHAFYDFTFGYESGIANWYPPMCVGFDVIVGSGLIVLILQKQCNAT